MRNNLLEHTGVAGVYAPDSSIFTATTDTLTLSDAVP